MKAIYKYQILPPGVEISMPIGAKIVGAKQYLGTAFLKNGLVFHVYEMV